jgi:transcriptional regulator with XRE-family HTH domain
MEQIESRSRTGTTMKHWENRKYRQIENAMLREAMLLVQFKDGSLVEVMTNRLLPPDVPNGQWENLEIAPNEIRAIVGGKQVEVSWNLIRLLTDSAYSSYEAERAEEQAKTVGMRIRSLREAKALTSKDLAQRAGISAQSLSRIENGKHDVVFTTLQRILAAMGCTLRDLAEAPVASGDSVSVWTDIPQLIGSTPQASLSGSAQAVKPEGVLFHEVEPKTPSNTPGFNTPSTKKRKAA